MTKTEQKPPSEDLKAIHKKQRRKGILVIAASFGLMLFVTILATYIASKGALQKLIESESARVLGTDVFIGRLSAQPGQPTVAAQNIMISNTASFPGPLLHVENLSAFAVPETSQDGVLTLQDPLIDRASFYFVARDDNTNLNSFIAKIPPLALNAAEDQILRMDFDTLRIRRLHVHLAATPDILPAENIPPPLVLSDLIIENPYDEPVHPTLLLRGTVAQIIAQAVQNAWRRQYFPVSSEAFQEGGRKYLTWHENLFQEAEPADDLQENIDMLFEDSLTPAP